MNNLIYVSIYEHVNDARNGAVDFVKDLDPESVKHMTRSNRPDIVITLKDGTEYHFMVRDIYNSWCLGKTYKFLYGEDIFYHSGHKASDIGI